ncbi:unnamed protein product [Rotaria sp. Silwood1]|nr:unnamed protein product [Rotaria sp. Silwood1]
MEESISKTDVLSKRSKFAYSIGNVLNDITTSMWFSYILLFYNRVVTLTNVSAGYLLLIGQIADALSTIFVALTCDRTRTGLFHYEKRKTWHLIGVICVLISFPFLFNLCIGCQHSKLWVKFIYYAVFIIIYQFGWVCSHVVHLAMINELTHIEGEHVTLNSDRIAWNFVSNIFLFTMASILLGLSATSDQSSITPADAPLFLKLTFIVVGFGLICMIIFHIGLKESNQTTEEREYHSKLISTSNRKLKQMTWKSFLCEKEFYQCAFIWVCARVVLTVTVAFLPLYIIDTISRLDRIFIGVAPLCACLSGLLTSFSMRAVNERLGRNLTNIIGYGLALVGMILLWFIIDIKSKVEIEIALISTCILLGIGASTTGICSITLASDLIGLNTECGAFVYGVMSFLDKIANGIIIAIVQQFNPCKLSSTQTCASYYRCIVTLIPGGFSILSILMILSMWKTNLGGNRYEIIQEEQCEMEMKTKVDYNERSPLVD